MPDTLERDKNDSRNDSLNPANRPGNQPGSIDMSEFEDEFNPQSPITGNNLRGRADKPRKPGASAEELKEAETPPDRSGFSNRDATNERLGRGYTGDGSKKSKGLAKLFSSKSKLKKRVAVAGAAAGGSALLGVIVFFALLPLKIEHIIQNLDNKFTSTSEAAVGTEVDNLFTGYVKNAIIPSINSGKCHKTVDPTCHVVASGTGPVASLYQAWSKVRLENKLAQNQGLIIGKNSDGKFFVNVAGHDVGNAAQLKELQRPGSTLSLFDLDGTREISRNDLRNLVRTRLREGTLWDRTYGRFKVGKYLEKNFGIKRCVIACNSKDKFTDKIADKKLAAKAYLIQRLVPEKYGAIMACISQPGTCGQTLGDAEPGEGERRTPGQQSIADILESSRGRFSDEGLAKLVSFANDAAKDGLTKTIASVAAEKLVTTVAGEEAGQAAAQGASKAIPVIGWVLLAAQIHQVGDSLGKTVKWMNYSANAASAVELYSSYSTVASEAKSGHVDATELGSFTDALSTNLTGTKSDQADATTTPLYASLMNETSSNTASIFGSMFGTAHADSMGDPSKYKCDDGSNVPAGKLVCPEEKLAQANSAADGIQSVLSSVDNIPGSGAFFSVVDGLNNLIGDAFSSAFSTACSAANLATFGSCDAVTSAVSGLFGELFSWIGKKLIISPFSDSMSGGRSFDMMAAGSDVANNASCRDTLGCSQASATQVATIQSQQAENEQQDFDSKPLFARIFSTDTPYSLVSNLSMDVPSDSSSAIASGMSSVLANPLHTLGSLFSSAFSGNHAFAATTPQADAFGVQQYAYQAKDIPSDPQTFFDQNCVQGPLALYDSSAKQLDTSPWLNNDPHYKVSSNPDVYVDFTSANFDGKAGTQNTGQDQTTGEQTNLRSNPCQLVLSAIQASGATSDSTLLPPDDSDTSDAAPTGAGDIAASDKAPAYCQSANTAPISGGQKIVCAAYQFDDYDYSTPGIRPTGAALQTFVNNVQTCVSGSFGAGCKYPKFAALVDCSGMVDASVFAATGIDLKAASTGAFPGHAHLQEIPIGQAQPGDIAWWSSPDGHTEVIVNYDASAKKVQTFGAHDSSGPNASQIGPDSYPNSWGPLPQKVFKVVP